MPAADPPPLPPSPADAAPPGPDPADGAPHGRNGDTVGRLAVAGYVYVLVGEGTVAREWRRLLVPNDPGSLTARIFGHWGAVLDALAAAEARATAAEAARDHYAQQLYGITYQELSRRIAAVQRGEHITHAEAMARLVPSCAEYDS